MSTDTTKKKERETDFLLSLFRPSVPRVGRHSPGLTTDSRGRRGGRLPSTVRLSVLGTPSMSQK